MTRCMFGDANVFFHSLKFDSNVGSHWMHFSCICHILFRMFSCLQMNCQPFYLCQLLKFHPFDWLIEIYLQTEGQGTHHRMASFQPMPGFSPPNGQMEKLIWYSMSGRNCPFLLRNYYFQKLIKAVMVQRKSCSKSFVPSINNKPSP